ncbi:MAG: sporulation protein YqfD [Lachnospiraceae bacterium]|nr:sporulation protein YqfD [Lachnospiraceae bacterium]
MFKKILIWLKGYLIIKITGISRSRFINLCVKNNLDMWNICEKEDYSEACISKNSYNKMTDYVEKTTVKISVEDKRGLPYLFYRYKKRKLFALGLILFILAIYSFSFFIWDINVDGENIYTKEQILRDLEEFDIKAGTPKKKIDCAGLERKLREKYDNIAWISCELKGTRLNISINETISPEMIKENTSPCNIIAMKSGIVTDIVLESGTRVVNKGDEVKKGDILITGAINLYNDYDELIETSYVPANGEIYAICSYDYKDIFSLDYYEKEYTGNSKKYYGLTVFYNTFMPFKPKNEYNNYDMVEEDNKLKLFDSFYLPISLKTNEVKEYEPVLKKYSNSEAEDKAYLRLNEYISNFNKKGVEILENNVKITISDTECVAEGTIITKELIGVPSELTIINQGESMEDGIY